MLQLITLPNPILRQRVTEVPLPPSQKIIDLIPQMFSAMENYQGIGLAANQINKSISLMVIATSKGPRAFINPRILKRSWSKDQIEEGCLSIPGVFGQVRRSTRIYVSHLTDQGKVEKVWYEGMMARVYQHEVDHLNGVLFIDQAKIITQGQELLKQYERT
ncbi:MAG: peptide deformylase [Patescibacteria group bacterium]